MPSLFSKNSNYILNISTVEDRHLPLAGRLGVMHSQILASGIPILDSFVVSSSAFDDFMTAAGLVEPIMQELSKVRQGDSASAQNASAQIEKLIEQANFPSILISPILHAYKGMSGLTEKYLRIQPSEVIPSEVSPKNQRDYIIDNAKGEASLLYAIKRAWMSLFSQQAILLRVNRGYTGGISVAVLVERLPQAEVTGFAYSYGSVSEDEVEVHARLGIMSGTSDVSMDIYKLDESAESVIERNIFPQTQMYIRKGRATPGESPLIEVEVSSEWQRKQKLADQYVTELGQMSNHLSKLYGCPVEVEWALEAGKLYITECKPIISSSLPADNILDSSVSKILPGLMQGASRPAPEYAEEGVDEVTDETSEVEESIPEEVVHAMEEEPSMPLAIDEIDEIDEEDHSDPPSIHREYDLVTHVYLNLSDLDTGSLTNARRLDGGYFNSTDMVLRHKVLPEVVAADKSLLNNLVESYAIEISTASRAIFSNPLIFSFSDIGDVERGILLGEVPHEEHLDGCERFVTEPDAILAEVLAVKRAKQNYNAGTIRIVLPKLRSLPELAAVKRLLSEQGIKRSSSLQLFAEIAVPAFLHEVGEIHPTELDGILINLPKLGLAMAGRKRLIERDLKPTLSAIKNMLSDIANKRFTIIVALGDQPELISSLYDYNIVPNALILDKFPDSQEFFGKLKEIESSALIKRPNPQGGRPIKSLN